MWRPRLYVDLTFGVVQIFNLDIAVVRARRGRTVYMTAHENEALKPVRARNGAAATSINSM